MRETCVHNHTPTAFDGRIAFTPSEAAEILGVDRGLIYRMIAAKKFLVIKVGVAYIVPLQSLETLKGSFAPEIDGECSEVYSG